MNKDEKDFELRVAARLHQKERMRAWVRHYDGAQYADQVLAEFDKRFPAPAAVDTDRERRENLHCVISDLTDQCREANTELAALREKARLWDAVASGKVQLRNCTEGYWAWFGDGTNTSMVTDTYNTAAEAVQAAIDAGALK